MYKKILFVLFAFLYAVSLVSCGGDDNEKDEPTPPQDNTITLSKIEGVWASGDYFVSFSSDKFCTAFVAPVFLDSGSFQLADGVVTCRNSYFNHSTIYTIKSVTDSKMSVEVAYTDFRGDNKTATVALTKTAEFPVEKENPLVGKSYTSRSQYFGTVTNSFTTYCSGQKTASDGNAKKYPLNIFYIYRDGKYYQQLYTNKNHQTPSIGAWTTNADDGEIQINQVTFSADGSIESVETIKKI